MPHPTPDHTLYPKERKGFKPHETPEHKLEEATSFDHRDVPVGKALCKFIRESLVYLRTRKEADKPDTWNLAVLEKEVYKLLGVFVEKTDRYMGKWFSDSYERLRDYGTKKPKPGDPNKTLGSTQYEYLVKSIVDMCENRFKPPYLTR